ncbi:MAG: methylhydantoinase [Alphaproteobacteria bacterium]|nr:methylhydantoinase [Alphaproteobacteria bacterium]
MSAAHETDSPAVDAATTEVIRHYMVSAAREMERTLVCTAYSTIIYEIYDFGISLFDREFRLLADSTGLPVFLGANDYAIKKTAELGCFEDLAPGDVIMMNVPYVTGAHTNDGILVRGAFHDGELVAYACVRAHWTDIGGKDPGYILDSTSIHQEGLMIPGIKIFEKGVPNETVLEIMRANSRAPVTIMGDMNAEVASIRVGCERVEELYAKYGADTVEAAIERYLDVGEEQARAAIADLPKGTWEAENWMDNDGVDRDRMVRVHATVTIDDDGITFDMSGSDEKVRGPINLAIGMTESMSRIVFKSLTTPDEPTNGGQFRPFSVIAPPGNLFHAVYPSPVFTIWASVVGMETIYQALSKAMPERIPAGSGGDLGDPGFYGVEPYTKRQIWHQTNAGIGWGARVDSDGLNALHHISQCTLKNVPVEVLEARLPILLTESRLRQDSGGPGRNRGGLGTVRNFHFLDSFGALTILKKSRTKGWGMEGGEPGPMNVSILKPNPDDPDWEERWARDIIVYSDNDDVWGNTDPLRKHAGMYRGEFGPSDEILYLADGGGGYGHPFEREPERVRDDVIDGYVSREAARESYGVALTDDLEIDEAETKRLRE